MTTLKLNNTKAALAKYDSVMVEIEKVLDQAEHNGHVWWWMTHRRIELDKVREAFFQDTKDRNNLSACMVTDITWLRSLVEKYG